MKRREPLGIDLTPVIDIVFILLIFFIVASVFKKEQLALIIDLPTANSKATEISDGQIFIELNETKLALRGVEISFESFEESLKVIKDNKKTIIINIDKDTKYQRVTKILDLLQKYDLNNLALVTQKEK